MNSLEIKNLDVSYGSRIVLVGINLILPVAKLIGIIGANGGGKSTLFKAALNLIKINSGEIKLLGKNFKKNLKKIAYIPQRNSIDWDFPITVFDMVLMGRLVNSGLFMIPKKQDKEATYSIMQTLGIANLSKFQIGELSEGQKQRAFLARALLQDPDIYLLDEPFSGVDLATEQVILKILQDLVNKGKTVLVIYHGLHRVKKYFDWLVMLNRSIIASGPTNEVFTSENIKQTFGENFDLGGLCI